MELIGTFLSTTNNITKDTDTIVKYFYYRPDAYEDPEADIETIFDLKELSGFPQIGDTLSEASGYQIESINVSKRVDDREPGVQKVSYVVACQCDTSYNIYARNHKDDDKNQREKYIDEDGKVVDGATRPWKMKPTWGWTPVSVEIPFIKAFNNNDQKVVDVLNSAGKRLVCSTTKYRYEINWSKSYQERKTFFNLYEPYINNAAWVPQTIPGKNFPAGTVLILPPGFNVAYFENRDKEDKPTTYEVYYTYNVKLIYDYEGWNRNLLNVGTYAKFNNGPAEQIYSYKVKSGNIWGTLQFGSLSDVNTAVKNSGAENVSYEKVTESLPLTNNGGIFTAAITDPVNNPYLEKSYKQYKSLDFSTLPI